MCVWCSYEANIESLKLALKIIKKYNLVQNSSDSPKQCSNNYFYNNNNILCGCCFFEYISNYVLLALKVVVFKFLIKLKVKIFKNHTVIKFLAIQSFGFTYLAIFEANHNLTLIYKQNTLCFRLKIQYGDHILYHMTKRQILACKKTDDEMCYKFSVFFACLRNCLKILIIKCRGV